MSNATPGLLAQPFISHLSLSCETQRYAPVHAPGAYLGYRDVATDGWFSPQLEFDVTFLARRHLQPGDCCFRLCDQETALPVGLEPFELGFAGAKCSRQDFVERHAEIGWCAYQLWWDIET